MPVLSRRRQARRIRRSGPFARSAEPRSLLLARISAARSSSRIASSARSPPVSSPAPPRGWRTSSSKSSVSRETWLGRLRDRRRRRRYSSGASDSRRGRPNAASVRSMPRVGGDHRDPGPARHAGRRASRRARPRGRASSGSGDAAAAHGGAPAAPDNRPATAIARSARTTATGAGANAGW